MRRQEFKLELLFHINCPGALETFQGSRKPAAVVMRLLHLLSVIFHCSCQTALGQQEQPRHQGEEEGVQGVAVQESGFHLASVNRSDNIGGSDQT